MSRNRTAATVVLLMVLLIVSVDIAFFRHHFWMRLIANVLIVLVVGSVYVRYSKRR